MLSVVGESCASLGGLAPVAIRLAGRLQLRVLLPQAQAQAHAGRGFAPSPKIAPVLRYCVALPPGRGSARLAEARLITGPSYVPTFCSLGFS